MRPKKIKSFFHQKFVFTKYCKMVRRINCSYTNYISYVIPKNVPLLTVEQNEAVTEEGIPFSWWVKWVLLL